MSKMDTHATSPRYAERRRNRQAMLRRAEKDPRRSRTSRGADSQLRSCPWCGHGLSARYRTPGAVHLRRNRRPPEVCGWTP